VLSASEEYDPDYFGIPERWQRMTAYPLETYYLDIYNVKSGEWREYMIRRNVPAKGWGRIVRWVE
jgi:hypothetical protein